MIENKKRGRKTRHPIESLRTKVWVEYVKQSANKTALSVEVMVRGEPLQPLEKLYRWNRYENGLHSPRQEYIEYIDQIFPGSRNVYELILWEILLSESLTQQQVNEFICKLKPEVKFLLMSALKTEFIKRRPFDERVVEILIERGEIDCLVVALLMLHESVALCSEELRNLALALYAGLTEKIALDPLFFKIHPELFSYIDKTFHHYVFVAPNIRLNAVIFWQTYRKNLWPEALRLESERLEERNINTRKSEISPKTRIESLDGTSYFDP